MILGYLIVGMFVGSIAAIISLFLNASVLMALGVYSIMGTLGVLAFAVAKYIWPGFLGFSIAHQKRKTVRNLHKSAAEIKTPR